MRRSDKIHAPIIPASEIQFIVLEFWMAEGKVLREALSENNPLLFCVNLNMVSRYNNPSIHDLELLDDIQQFRIQKSYRLDTIFKFLDAMEIY